MRLERILFASKSSFIVIVAQMRHSNDKIRLFNYLYFDLFLDVRVLKFSHQYSLHNLVARGVGVDAVL